MNISDLTAWLTNVATSVCIIFVNKLLMGSQGYVFNFAVTLSGLHYLAAALLMQTYKCSGLMTATGVMPWKDRLIFTAVSSLSIVSLNVSLLLNNVRTTSPAVPELAHSSLSCPRCSDFICDSCKQEGHVAACQQAALDWPLPERLWNPPRPQMLVPTSIHSKKQIEGSVIVT